MLSLVILAFNDGKSLQENIPDWIKSMASIPGEFELIIADDGSSDNTPQVADELSRQYRQIKYVRNSNNKGVGANFRMGIEQASGEFIAYTDGDGQYLPTDLDKLWREMDSYDMITGRRRRRADPFSRTIASIVYNRLVRTIYPISVIDINSGLKIFKRKFIDLCGPQISDGPFFDAEYLIKGVAYGMRIKEIPIGHRKRKYGKAAGISKKSIGLLFREICHRQMSPYVQRNYFARLVFRLLTIQASFSLSMP